MKPGVEVQVTGSLPHARTRAVADSTTSGSVAAPRTTSTSRIRGAGLKKCRPTSRPGSRSRFATAVTDSDEVFVASTASSATTFSSAANRSRLTSRSSATASTTRPHGASASVLVTASSRSRTASAASASSRSLATSRSSRPPIASRAAAAAPSAASSSSTRWPGARGDLGDAGAHGAGADHADDEVRGGGGAHGRHPSPGAGGDGDDARRMRQGVGVTTSPSTQAPTTGDAPRTGSTPDQLVEKHRELLDQALAAIGSRGYWSRFPESPSPRVYGEDAAPAGEAAYRAHLDGRYEALASQPEPSGWVGSEVSPYGPVLGTTYPHYGEDDLDALLEQVGAGVPAWRAAGPLARAAVCAEILVRINARSFEMAHAVMHTTGQPFVMSFQAAGPHAQDRALEAVAYALAEQQRVPAEATWSKPGKGDPLVMTKRFHVVGRGTGLVIGCNTFPTWNSYPGLFASLATANAVVVKPHPRAVLPLAISVEVAREVLAENGFDPNLVVLAAEADGEGLAKPLALHPRIGVVDYTGGPGFGDWLERNVHQAVVYTEKAGLNTVVVDSTDDVDGLAQNLAFSFSLYSGQMCTAPQNVYVPADGIDTDAGHLSVDELGERISAAVQRLTGDDARAVGLLGAAVNPDVVARADGAGELGSTVAGEPGRHPPRLPGRHGAHAGGRGGRRRPTPTSTPASASDPWPSSSARRAPTSRCGCSATPCASTGR